MSLPPKDEKARIALDGGDVPELLLGSRCALDWRARMVSGGDRRFSCANWRALDGVGFGRVARPLRAAVLRDMATPDLVESLAALGQGESLKRLDEAERYLAQPPLNSELNFANFRNFSNFLALQIHRFGLLSGEGFADAVGRCALERALIRGSRPG